MSKVLLYSKRIDMLSADTLRLETVLLQFMLNYLCDALQEIFCETEN